MEHEFLTELKTDKLIRLRHELNLILKNRREFLTDEEKCTIIILTVSEFDNIPVIDMKSPSRKSEFVTARHIAMDLMVKLAGSVRNHRGIVTKKGVSLSYIGSRLNRDHASVCNAQIKVGRYLKLYPDYLSKYDLINNKVIDTFDNRELLATRIDRIIS